MSNQAEFKYDRNIPSEQGRVVLDEHSHQSAYRAAYVVQEIGLGITVFSYSEILAQASGEQDPIEACARMTGTLYKEQLKALFASDASLDGQHMPNAVIAVLSYPDRADYKKMAAAIPKNPQRRIGQLTSRVTGIESLGVVPAYLGVNSEPLRVPALFTPRPGENFDPYTGWVPLTYIVDVSIRRLEKFCMLVGFQAADALVVINGQNEQLGDKVDSFFRGYFDRNPFVIADIKKAEV